MEPILHVRALRKSFGQAEILRGIDLKIAPRELVFVIGPSGSGKSTLLRCCNRLEEPTSGAIMFDGVDLMARDTNINAMRRRIGMVFQQFNLFWHMTVLENIIEAPMLVLGQSRRHAEQRAMELLARVGLADKADSYPQKLSGGQQQRAAIARALAMDPELMLFDEPTSALDPETTGEVLKVMAELAQSGMTMVIVTHEMAFARQVSNHVALMEDGVVVCEATPKVFFEDQPHPRVQAFLSKMH